ncbi:MAG: hypothetical protein ISS83_01510 [Candidatus Pacebacteria bacterium]|nr:hypothetical protein [Candidatus Paceibacterota bacterium]
MKKKIILIGGAPRTGKTFLAKELSKKLGIPWISTDTIREFMREVADKKKYPNLFHFLERKPEIYLPSHTPEQIVKDQNKESVDVWKGVKSFIKSDYNWESYIIEGVAILPNLVSKDFSRNKSIKAIFVLNDNKKELENRIFKFGLWDDAGKYPDRLKPKELEWVIQFNLWLKGESKKYKYPAIEIEKGRSPSLLKIITRLNRF